jgi:hypothetical protein
MAGRGAGGDNFKRNVALLFGAVLFAYIVLGLILWTLLNAYIQPSSSTEKKDLFQALGLILTGLAGTFAGLAAIVGVYVTWRNLKQTQKSTDDNLALTRENLDLTRENLDRTQENTNKTLELTRRGQIIDRFTEAVTQLGTTKDGGAKQVEVRLGGIYALERIAKEDPANHHWPVMEVLTGYLRENAAWEGPGVSKDDPDIQAALTVIGQRDRHFGAGEDYPLNFFGTDLMEMDLEGAHLERARFPGVHLEGANLNGAHLDGAILLGAHLEGARLYGANLEKAYLRGAHLEGADLRGATLKEADVAGAHLRRARVSHTDLSELLNLSQSELEQVNGDAETTQFPSYLKKPAWWRTLPSEGVPLDSSKDYSIKLAKFPVFFRTSEYWEAAFVLPNTLYFSEAGVTHVGPMFSFNHVEKVCDPTKPTERHALVPAPLSIRKWSEWLHQHPYLEVGGQEEVEIGGVSGTQFEVFIPQGPRQYALDCHRPCVPLFHSNRGYPNRILEGYQHRLTVLSIKGTTIIILMEGPPEEFEDFVAKANQEILHTVRWGV